LENRNCNQSHFSHPPFLANVIKGLFSLSAQRQLADNETHVQLTNLEKKLSHLEQNAFTVEEFVANKKAELNFEPVKLKVLQRQWEYNKMLVELAKGRATAPTG